jgi:xanthine dehydrogenase accessory factor
VNKKTLTNYLSELADPDMPQVLATVVQAVSPTAAKPGDKALVSAEGIADGWIGGGCAQPAVIATAADVLRDGKARLIRIAPKGEWSEFEGVADFYSGCLSGGSLMIFLELLQAQSKLTIFGNSPVARHLVRLSQEVGFAVSIAYPNANDDDFANSDIRVIDNFKNIDSEFIVIATQGQHDNKALKAALNSQAKYIAMVASEKKAKGLKEKLADSGVAQSDLDRIKSPAGVAIGANTPAEIALSVVAALVEYRNSNKEKNKNIEPANSPITEANHSEAGGCCGSN